MAPWTQEEKQEEEKKPIYSEKQSFESKGMRFGFFEVGITIISVLVVVAISYPIISNYTKNARNQVDKENVRYLWLAMQTALWVNNPDKTEQDVFFEKYKEYQPLDTLMSGQLKLEQDICSRLSRYNSQAPDEESNLSLDISAYIKVFSDKKGVVLYYTRDPKNGKVFVERE